MASGMPQVTVVDLSKTRIAAHPMGWALVGDFQINALFAMRPARTDRQLYSC